VGCAQEGQVQARTHVRRVALSICLCLVVYGLSDIRSCRSVRTHIGQSDEAYESVYQREDTDGVVGVALSRKIMQIAGDALKTNMTVLGPLVLPITEQLKFFANLVARRVLRGRLPLPRGLAQWCRRLLEKGLRHPWFERYGGAGGCHATPRHASVAAVCASVSSCLVTRRCLARLTSQISARLSSTSASTRAGGRCWMLSRPISP
jgi:hypothetical protein